MVYIVCNTSQHMEKISPHSPLLVFFVFLYLLWFLWISLALSFFLLKTVSALLLLHQKAVAKWRLTSAAATEEGLCVFSSWGQIPLKRAKLCISHCNENPCVDKLICHFQLPTLLYLSKYTVVVHKKSKFSQMRRKSCGPPPTTFSLLYYCQSFLFLNRSTPTQSQHRDSSS